MVSESDGWIELFPGQEVSRRFTLRLDADVAWQRGVNAGKEYWLRWAPSGTVGNPKSLWSWKYGALKVSCLIFTRMLTKHRAVADCFYVIGLGRGHF